MACIPTVTVSAALDVLLKRCLWKHIRTHCSVIVHLIQLAHCFCRLYTQPHFCSYTLLPTTVRLLETLLKHFRLDGLHCGRHSFHNLSCSLEMKHLKTSQDTFLSHCTPASTCPMFMLAILTTTFKYSLSAGIYFCVLRVLQTFLEHFRLDRLRCGRRNFLNIRCSLETASFVIGAIFSRRIVLSSYTCCNMSNVSAGYFFKRRKNFVLASFSSSGISAFDECERLQFSNTHCLKKSCTE